MTDPVSAAQFHDDLSADYHLLYADWDEAMAQQAAMLAKLIESGRGTAKGPVLDCACGIGTQALGLAALGWTVTGTDISPKAIARAKGEAKDRGLAARFVTADMRELPRDFRDAFDIVIGLDDPLSHLGRPEQLRIAFLGMRTALSSGGMLLVSCRDYDKLLVDRPREMAFRHRSAGNRTVIVFQIWEWDQGAPTYVNNQFILQSRMGGWKTFQSSTRLHAYTRREITEELEAAGLAKIRWHEPNETGYFEPIVSAVSPS